MEIIYVGNLRLFSERLAPRSPTSATWAEKLTIVTLAPPRSSLTGSEPISKTLPKP
jgi:hypothetical protein